MEALKSSEPDAKVNALAELAKAGPDAAPAVPELIPLLKDPDPLTRRLSAYALGQVGPKASAALPALRELLNDPDVSVVQNAINAMRFIDPNTPQDLQMPNVMTK
jgi:HEAT repeat protein